MSINRTYQGRITAAYNTSGKKHQRADQIPEGTWQDLLTQHLSIFQSAINYYLAAFAACARGSELSALQNLEHKVRETWENNDYRKSGEGPGIRKSLITHLPGLVTAKTTFDEFADRLLGPKAEASTLHLAIESLLTDLGGESSIQQGGRSYLPYFCSPNTTANFPRSRLRLERIKAKETLPQGLHSSEGLTGEQLLQDYDVHHLANLEKDKDPVTGKKLRNQAADWAKHLAEEDLITTSQLKAWLPMIEGLPDETSIPAYNGASAKGAEKNRLYAFLFCKLLGATPERMAVLKATFPEPKAPQKDTKELSEEKRLAEEQAVRLVSLGDDPIELSRGERKAVFASFTNLLENEDFAEGPAWAEFDILAFKQALMTLNQIKLKISERETDLSLLHKQIAYFERKEGTPYHFESPISFYKDDRFALVQKLHEEFAKLQPDFSESGVTMRKATIKGWDHVRDRFCKAIEKNPEITTEDLIEKGVKVTQRRTKNIGSAALFELLAKPEFRPIWQPVTTETAEVFQKNEWSHDLLADYVIYCRLQAEAEDLAENLEIGLTPAHLQHSRRPIMLSDVGGAHQVIYKNNGEGQPPSLVTSIYAKNPETDCYEKRRIELVYSAPRLQRDSLTGLENRCLLQPLMKGLGLNCPPEKEVAKAAKSLAVSLMPDWFANSNRGQERKSKPDRFLLNFPARLETDWVQEALGKAAIWDQKQFNGPSDDLIHLHWPDTMKKADQKTAWWTKPEVLENGFTVASFDLGMRTAAACAIYQITCHTDQIPPTKKPFTREIGQAGGRTWHAYPLSREMIRLQGEDQVIQHRSQDGEKGGRRHRVIEPYGKRGRPADPLETETFVHFVGQLGDILPEWLHKAADEEAVKTSSYLLRQNELLLRALKILLSHLSRCHRFYLDLLADNEIKLGENESKTRIAELVSSDKTTQAKKDALDGQIRSQRKVARNLLLTLAQRILPQKKSEWILDEPEEVTVTNNEGEPKKFQPYILTRQKLAKDDPTPTTRIRGQGGLTADRLELIEDLRRRAASFQRELNKTVGVKQTIGFGSNSGSIPDAAPGLLQKLDHLKDQRQKQTAHFLLARALGLRLKQGAAKDPDRPDYVHGEYEPHPSGKIADFIAIENLDRYKADQGRTKAENRQLMSWAHRAVTATLRELAEPYGIPVLAVPAAYSSQFCASTSRPGFRAVELSPQNASHPALQRLKDNPDRKLSDLGQQIEELLQNQASNKKLKVLIPSDGGPIFVPAFRPQSETPEQFPRSQADLNAAQNLALRAVASPQALHLLHKLRIETNKKKLYLRRTNEREKKGYPAKTELHLLPEGAEVSPDISGKKFGTFFWFGEGDFIPFAPNYEHFKTTLPDGRTLHLASNRSRASTVKACQAGIITAINNPLLHKLGLPLLKKES